MLNLFSTRKTAITFMGSPFPYVLAYALKNERSWQHALSWVRVPYWALRQMGIRDKAALIRM